MKKSLAWLLAMAMMAGLFCSGLAVSAAGAVVYSEDFQDGKTDIQVWGDDPAVIGTMTIATEGSNKLLKCVTNTGDGENGYTHTAFGPSVHNFDFEVKFRPDNIKNPNFNWAKIFYRAGPEAGENESYIFEMWDWRGAMSIKSTANRKSETKKLTENQDVIFENGKWYTIRVEGRENKFTVYVDGKQCTTMTDADNIFSEGIFGFASWGVNFSVDNIKITSYDAADQTTTGKPGTTTKPGASTTASSGGSTASTKPGDTTSLTDSSITGDSLTTDTDASDESESTNGSSTTDDSVASVDSSSTDKGGPGGGLIVLLIALAVLVIGGGVAAFFIIKKQNMKDEV